MKVKLNTEEEEPLQYYVLKDGSDNQNYLVLFGKCFLCATFLLIIVLGGWNALAEKQVVEMGDFIEAGVGVAENDFTQEVDVGSSCFPIVVNSEYWGNEIRWRITTHENGATDCNSKDGYPNRSKTKETCCLPNNKYHLHCEDTYGDGWHGGSISIAHVNYCSNFKRGKFHQPVFWLENGRVTKTEPTACTAYNRHECCGKKDQRSSYKGNECVPHKTGRWPTFYAHLGFLGAECEPLGWINNNGYQSQKGQC